MGRGYGSLDVLPRHGRMSPTRFRLQEVIDEKETSQSELSRTSGVSFTTISRMCRNVTAQVSLETLDRLARSLQVGPGDLLEQDAPAPKKRGKEK